jgi:hypothetical protein
LLVCAMCSSFPPILIGGKAVPVPTSARPSVQFSKSCGVASLRHGYGAYETAREEADQHMESGSQSFGSD